MHHSGEFEELGIDSEGIYAIRGLNHQRIRTYEMSTGQRSTIAMAVMFTLHMAASDAPQFLLLDEPLATMDDTQVLNVLDILKSMAENKTQIFFTTANGIMINLFKETFKNTDFDYKEYEFVKRVNRPSEIKEYSINDVRTIEELTLDDLTLDFNQFAQIRDILRRNQEKLVPKDEWEVLAEKKTAQNHQNTDSPTKEELQSNFYYHLSEDECRLINVLVNDDGDSASMLRNKLAAFSTYKMMLERINEKAIDFFGETIVDNDDELPWMDDDYKEELATQYKLYSQG
jgi:ABC-type multidrug transport system ATPase subunit